MECSLSEPVLPPALVSVFATCLAVILVATASCNSYFLAKLYQPGGKWLAGRSLASGLLIIGTSEVTLSTTVFGTTLVAGHWLLGNTTCQFYGLVYNILHYGWVWILAIASIERYVKCHLPTEHTSLFSPTNTRIMALGSLLLLMVMYLSPVYGWGEYSYFRGKVNLELATMSDTVPPEHLASYNRGLYHLLKGAKPHSVQDHILTNLRDYLATLRSPTWRTVTFSKQGTVEIALRFLTKGHFKCFMLEYVHGSIYNGTRNILMHNGTLLGIPQFTGIDIILDMNENMVNEYVDVALTYQGCGTCGIDYTNVNNNIYSFLGLSLVFNLLLPFCVMIYCFTQTLILGPVPLNPISPGDLVLAKIFATTAAITFVCDVPELVINLVFGLGHKITPSVVVTMNLIRHCRNLSLVLSSLCCRKHVREACATPCYSPTDSRKLSQNSRSSLMSMQAVGRQQGETSGQTYNTFQETTLVSQEGSVANGAHV